MKAQEYKNKLTELENQIAKLSKESRNKLLKLCKANPDAVVYSYRDSPTTKKNVYGKDFTKEDIQHIKYDEAVFEYINTLEKHIESRNPRRQLEMDFKPQCPKIGTCKVTPHHCACDMKDTHTC